jgi:hypothetical protein
MEESKKRKKIVADEEKQLCRSMLHVSQDPIIGRGKRINLFGRGLLHTTTIVNLYVVQNIQLEAWRPNEE